MRRITGTLIATALFIAGCGGASDAPQTVAVSGTVKLDDAPLEGAIVTFVDPAGKNSSATGATDASGNYSLSTGANAGAIPGSYNVSISRLVGPDGSPVAVEEGMDAEQLQAQGLAKQSLPSKYVDGTELKAEVKSGTSNTHNFTLKKEGEVAPDAGAGEAP